MLCGSFSLSLQGLGIHRGVRLCPQLGDRGSSTGVHLSMCPCLILALVCAKVTTPWHGAGGGGVGVDQGLMGSLLWYRRHGLFT